MTDFDTIWRTQDEIRTVVNAVLGESIWNLSYNERRMAIELELTKYLEEEDADALICQFPVPADYDGAGSKGTKFTTFIFDASINHGKYDCVKYYMPDYMRCQFTSSSQDKF